MATKKTKTKLPKLNENQGKLINLLRVRPGGTIGEGRFDKRTGNSLVSKGLARLTSKGVLALTAAGKKGLFQV